MANSGEKFRKLLTLLITWGLLMACFIGYEVYFVKGQTAFLQEREFRKLAALSRDLSARFDQARSIAASSIKLLGPTELDCVSSKREPTAKCLESLENYLDLYLEGAWIPKTDRQARQQSLTAAIDCRQPADPGLHPLQFEADGLTLKVYCGPHLETDKPIYVLKLARWIQQDFQQLDGDFDDVIVADSEGRVLLQKSTGGASIGNLKLLVANGLDASLANQQATMEGGKGPAKAAQTSASEKKSVGAGELQELLEVATVRPVTLGGGSYQLFSQPVSVAAAESSKPGPEWKLVVCGLRGTERLEAQSHTMPYSTLIWAILIVVALFSLSWPLFKLRYIGNTERFRPQEGWYLILAILMVSASGMLMLLNASYTSWSRDAADAGLRNIAEQMKYNYKSEMTRAAAQLHLLGSQTLDHIAKDRSSQPLVGNYLGKSPLPYYPYFEVVFYAGENGDQVLKFDVRNAPTPNINVSDRPFFKAALSDPNSDASPTPQVACGEPACHRVGVSVLRNAHLEPLLSRNTHEFLAVLSTPARDTQNPKSTVAVKSLSIRPMSLVDPVLPPGYQFAVLDTECGVLFHSQSFRNMQENFCQESKNQDELRPRFFSGGGTPFDISYGGQTERAYLTPMPAEPRFTRGQAFLIVFREPGFDLTLNLAIILVCSILMGAYFTFYLLAAGVHLALRGPLSLIYAPRFIWPGPRHALGYVQLFVANGFMLLLFWQLYARLYEGPLLILTFTVAGLSVTFVVCRLNLFRQALRLVGAALIGGALLGWVASTLPNTFLPLDDWNLVFVFFLFAGFVTLLLLAVTRRIPPRFGRSFTFDRLDDWAKRHFKVAHTLVALSLITTVVLVPCIGCFKYAYDVVSELSMKHDQVEVTDALWARRTRILKYYKETVQGAVANQIGTQRMAEPLDYPYVAPGPMDSAFRPSFALGCGPDCSSPEPACQTADQDHGPESSDDSPQETINHWIEKQVARAALLLPSNRLGSEMSELGVASTRGLNGSWKERTATCFTLTREIEPGQVLTVTSEYQTWQGLRFWPWVCLILLWVVLFVWLMSLAKKIFFTDIADTPRFPLLRWKGVADIQGNFLVIGRAKSGKSGWLKALRLPKDDQLDLREHLAAKVAHPYYYSIPVGSGQVLVLDHFEFNLKNPDYNQARLELIEDLLRRSIRLVVVSTVDPLYFLTEGAPGVLSSAPDPAVAQERLDRWARALSQFTKVRRKEPWDRNFFATLRAFIKQDPDRKKFAGWIKRECRYTSMLRRIGKELIQKFRKGDRATEAWVASRVLDRADAYYHVLWSGLTASERLVLYQLALDGWANPNNSAALQQLERKELIFRGPMYRIMNESFRLFIQSTEHADEIAEWERREQQSTWHAFRYVVIGAAVGGVLWLLHSHAELTQVVAGSIAAIVTLLTAVSTLFGRSGRQASPAPKDAP